jgi:serine/threonine protein kinase
MKIPRGYSHPVKIGSGSFSTVVRVQEAKLHRPVALKIISPRGRAAIAGVEKEAQLLASTTCSCVPRIYDVRRDSAKVTMVMEWIDGVPLSVFIETAHSPEIRRCVASFLVTALSQLHAHGIVHRDIKPENIILSPDRGAVFVDFGFSDLDRMARDHAESSPLKGTPRYMAPELWAKPDTINYIKSDLYSLGVVLRELYTSDAPPCIEELLRSDPSLRPDDCASFSVKWDECCGIIDDAPARTAIAKAAAGYTSRLLYEGALDLHGSGRRTEAYELLTESLDRWPDNPDAVAMIRDRFSLPMSNIRPRTIAAWIAAAFLLLCAIAGAYISGRRSQPSAVTRVIAAGNEPAERRLTIPFFPEGGSVRQPEVKIDLRELSGVNEPQGKISAVLPVAGGTLCIDARPVRVASGDRFSVSLAAGAHRLEWYDSTTRRTIGETVDLLPFATRTVSFMRYMNERR